MKYIYLISTLALIFSCSDSDFSSGFSGSGSDSSSPDDSGQQSGSGEFGGGSEFGDGTGKGEGNLPELTTMEDLIEYKCGSGKEVISRTISFSDPESCLRNEKVRLGPNGDYISAYSRVTDTISLPSNTTICSLDITSTNASVRYDDELLILFGEEDFFIGGANHTKDKLIAMGMSSEGNLVKWDYNKHRGTLNDHKVGSCADGVTTCTFPRTEVGGSFEMKTSEEWAKSLPFSYKSIDELKFHVITTGNQNNSFDCRQSGLTLNIEISVAK